VVATGQPTHKADCQDAACLGTKRGTMAVAANRGWGRRHAVSAAREWWSTFQKLCLWRCLWGAGAGHQRAAWHSAGGKNRGGGGLGQNGGTDAWGRQRERERGGWRWGMAALWVVGKRATRIGWRAPPIEKRKLILDFALPFSNTVEKEDKSRKIDRSLHKI
jgi:hypothetical protein